MKLAALSLCVVVAVAGCGSPGSPPPTPEPPGTNIYLPLADKQKATYGIVEPGSDEVTGWRVLEVDGQEDGGWKLYWGRMAKHIGDPSRKPDGIVRTTANMIRVGPVVTSGDMFPIIPADFSGATLSVPCDSTSEGHVCSGWESMVGKEEHVKTGVGGFDARKVTLTHTWKTEDGSGAMTLTAWYAMETGLVRFIHESTYTMSDGRKDDRRMEWMLIPDRD